MPGLSSFVAPSGDFGTAEKVALAVADAKGCDLGQLIRCLDTLGQHVGVERVGELDQRACELLPERIAVDPSDEVDVELDQAGPQAEDVAHARETGADVVHRETDSFGAPPVQPPLE